jgi:hypothetical protein
MAKRRQQNRSGLVCGSCCFLCDIEQLIHTYALFFSLLLCGEETVRLVVTKGLTEGSSSPCVFFPSAPRTPPQLTFVVFFFVVFSFERASSCYVFFTALLSALSTVVSVLGYALASVFFVLSVFFRSLFCTSVCLLSVLFFFSFGSGTANGRWRRQEAEKEEAKQKRGPCIGIIPTHTKVFLFFCFDARQKKPADAFFFSVCVCTRPSRSFFLSLFFCLLYQKEN